MMNSGLHILEMVTVRWFNACAEYALQLSMGLAGRGHRVVIGGFRGSPVLEKARSLGFPVLDAFDFRPGLAAPAMILPFRRYLASSEFDIVNAHRAEDHLFAALSAFRGGNIPVVRTRGDVRQPRSNLPNRVLYERLTDAHVLTAGFMRQRFYRKFRIRPDRLVVIPPGFDVDAFRNGAMDRIPARDSLGLPRHGRIVGVVGRLTAAKGQLVALDAFAQVQRTFPDARFVIAGAPYDISEADIRERARSLGLDSSLTLLPRVEDVRSIMAALDIGVIASTASEAICRVGMEYLAMGIPVVGTDVNSIPEIVPHGIAGLIVPPNDAAAMAAGVRRLLGDPALMERLGDAGPAHLKANYGLERMIEKTEALYRVLIRIRR